MSSNMLFCFIPVFVRRFLVTATFFASCCDAPRYGNVQGLTSPECSGVCRAGYYCPAGSTSDTAFPCGAGNYCPPGSGAPTPLPQGSCGIGHSPVTYSEFDWCLSISSVWPLSSPTTGERILSIVEPLRLRRQCAKLVFCDICRGRWRHSGDRGFAVLQRYSDAGRESLPHRWKPQRHASLLHHSRRRGF